MSVFSDKYCQWTAIMPWESGNCIWYSICKPETGESDQMDWGEHISSFRVTCYEEITIAEHFVDDTAIWLIQDCIFESSCFSILSNQ